MDSQEVYDKAIEKGGSIFITKSLSGEINLQANKDISELHFADGDITRIYNVPRTLKKLVINNNKLVDLPLLEFQNLVHLEAKANNINKLDLNSMPNLTYLNIANNKCTSIENIPTNLKTLIADNNLLTTLNLNNVNLKLVSCTGNPSLKYVSGSTNVESIVKDPNVQLKTKITEGVKHDLQEAINEYYRLKSTYETELRESKNKNVVKCVNCKKMGGTKFWKDDRGHLRAICGNSMKPCNLNIDILANLNETPYLIERTKANLNNIKQEIVKLKMDTIFGYISEAESVKKFENLTNELTNNNDALLLNDDKYSYYEIFNDSEKQRVIQSKMQNIHQELAEIRTLLNKYNKTGRDKFLVDVAAKHQTINNQMSIVRGLKYPVNEVILEKKMNVLKQYPYSFDELYNKHSDLLKVEKMEK